MDKPTGNALVVFLKYPQPGLVKTRLGKDIGPESAALLYKELTELILRNTEAGDYQRFLFYTPQNKKSEILKWLGGDPNLFLQKGNDLGQRLANAFKLVFSKGAKKVLVIGTDSPVIDREIIQQAFKQLDKFQCVIGPSFDGGYYLLGLGSENAKVFEGIDWSTNRVLEQTKQRLKKLEVVFTCLNEEFDIDTRADLEMFLSGKKSLELTLDK